MPSGQSSREILAREQFAGALEQQEQHLEGLRVELDADALAAKLSGGGVGFKGSEAIAPGWRWVGHVDDQCS